MTTETEQLLQRLEATRLSYGPRSRQYEQAFKSLFHRPTSSQFPEPAASSFLGARHQIRVRDAFGETYWHEWRVP